MNAVTELVLAISFGVISNTCWIVTKQQHAQTVALQQMATSAQAQAASMAQIAKELAPLQIDDESMMALGESLRPVKQHTEGKKK